MKKLKKILSIVLTIIVVFCSFPLISFAEDREDNFGDTYSLGGIVAPGLEQSFGSNAFSSPYFTQLGASVPKYREVTSLCFNLVNDSAIIDKGDKVTISVENLNSNILSCSTYANVSASYKGKSYDTVFAAGTFNNNVCTYVFEANGNIDYLFIEIHQNDIVYSKSVNLSSPAVLGLRSALYNTEDTKTGLLRTILDWLKAIKDSITEIPSKVQSFFTELKTQLSSAFSNIGTWFKELGQNIGQWFNDLGVRIQGFFIDLGNKIQTAFEYFINLFKIDTEHINQSVQDFKDYVYKKFDFFIEINDRINYLFILLKPWEASNRMLDIVLPELSFPINGKEIIILEETTFYLDSLFYEHPIFETIYDIYQSIIGCIIALLTINRLRDRFFTIVGYKA